MSKVTIKIAKNLEKLLKREGLNQRQLSQKSKVPQPTIFHIIQRNTSSLKNVIKLSKAFKCSIEDLIL